MKKNVIPLRLNFLILAVCWTIFIAAMMIYDFHITKENTIELARMQALTGLEKDITYRKWNAINGGVYGSVSESTIPNQYLTDQERDITTPSGNRILTMINPAYMTRQVHELEKSKNGVIGHITSLNPIRPENKADLWEFEGLKQFDQGITEVSSLERIGERSYLRVMQPLMVTDACMSCHAIQGYQVGEVRGGLSISVPMEQWFVHRKNILKKHVVFLVGLWVAVLAGLSFGYINLLKKIREVHLTQADLNKLKSVLDQINDSVFLINPDTLCLTYVNQAAITTSGYSEVELLNMSLVQLVPDEARQLYEKYIEQLKLNPEKIFHYESTFFHKNGDITPVDLQLQYLKLNEGTELVAAVLRDISSRQARERKEQEILSQLQQSQKMESVGQLAAGIAHEINTPVQYVGTNLDFLEESFSEINEFVDRQNRYIDNGDTKDTPAYTELEKVRGDFDWEYLKEEIPQAVHQSSDGIKQISSIVLAMKDFSHPGSAEMEFVDVNKLIQTVVTVARNEWKNIADVRLELTDQKSTVPCRPNEISQVLLNLLVNAAQAIGDSSHGKDSYQRGTIDIKSKRVGEFLEITVSDTGPGIPSDIIEKIFDPFFTTKEVGKGTGQGLAIAYDIITNKHHGSLEVKSKKDLGTTFIIHLSFAAEGKVKLSKSES